jgi:hypothetical protein
MIETAAIMQFVVGHTSTAPGYCGHSIFPILASIAREKPRISTNIFNLITRR